MERYIGKMLDNRYEILEVIGTGGMAVVFKAKCHRLNRLVAIKMLKRDLSEDAEFRRRFHEESQAVAMLSHPNIMAIYDVSRGGDMDYIVMELIDGITLKQYMERRGRLNWPEALHFITQIMKGLSHAHSRGIVHRDIKPQNIMVLRDGTVKVTDFGIACLTNGSNPSNEAIGSVHYISPEQAKGDYTDNRSDIYSAGVVLYEMLTSKLPFDGSDPVSIAIKHFSATPPSPREIDPEIPEALEQICMKAMAPDRNQRYTTADEMLADLDAFRKDPSLSFDYTMEDLQPEKEQDDEPTQFIPNVAVTRNKQQPHHPPADVVDDDEDEDEYDHTPRWLSWLKTLLLIIAVGAAGYFAVTSIYGIVMNSFKTPVIPEFEVPKVVGMTVEEAVAFVEEEGRFEIVEKNYDHDGSVPKNTILVQDPKEGQIKKTADSSKIPITVTVNLGAKTGGMPSLIGEEVRSARLILGQDKSLSGLNLVIEVSEAEEFHDTIPVGHVTRTEPEEGAVLSEGDTVTLFVSKGPEIKYVDMINFVGQSVEAVQQQINAMNLVAEFQPVHDSAPEGQILTQNAEAGAKIAEGTTVVFTYSDGPDLIEQTVTVNLPFKFNKVNVVAYLDSTVVFESSLPGNFGKLDLNLAAEPGKHALLVYMDDRLILSKEITFGE